MTDANVSGTTDALLAPREVTAKYADRIRAQQIHSMYVQSPTTTAGSLVAGAILAYGMWGQVAATTLVTWCALMCLHQAVRLFHYSRYKRAQPTVEQMPHWGLLYVLAVTVAGLLWGAAGYTMFVPHSPQHQTLLYLVLFGISSVSAIGLAAYAPAFYILIPLTIVPFIVRLLIEGGSLYSVMAGVAAVVLGTSLMFGRNMNRLIANSLRIRFENLDLIESLREQTTIANHARQEAEAANRSKTQFFAAASHDLRQPLHAMGLFAGALSERIKDPEVLNVVGSINQSVAALEGLFNELLDISKIDSGVTQPTLESFPIQRLLDRLKDEFAAECAAKGLAFRIASSRVIIHSDPVLLERIVRNLLANALRYTNTGEVAVTAERAGDVLRLEVHDTGVGIPADQQEKIFEEFYQLANPERSSRKGLGLGLSIVRRLTDLLGHPLALRSQPGHGTVFSLEVPLGTAPMPVAPSHAPVASGPADLRGRLIVVVDDETAIVEGMRTLLEGWGARVIGSNDGNDVQAAAEAIGRLPDLIVADYRLANNVVGTQVIERLRQALDPEIPAILVTGSTAIDRITEADVKRYELLLKPVQPARLREVIDRTLRR
jgi:signal transduction histidine kinase/CheY-like chemotaxis protein